MAIDEDAGPIAGSGMPPAAAAPAAPAAAAVSAGSSGQNLIISDTTEVRTRAGGASPCDVGPTARASEGGGWGRTCKYPPPSTPASHCPPPPPPLARPARVRGGGPPPLARPTRARRERRPRHCREFSFWKMRTHQTTTQAALPDRNWEPKSRTETPKPMHSKTRRSRLFWW